MAKGRKTLPDKLKHLKGTDQPCRVNKNSPEYSVFSILPDPPKELSDTAKGVYEMIGNNLVSVGLLSNTNLVLFISYCMEIALYLDIEKSFNSIDDRVTDVNTIKAKHRIARDALRDAKSLAAEFGLTPSSQSNIIIPFINKKSEFDQYLDE